MRQMQRLSPRLLAVVVVAAAVLAPVAHAMRVERHARLSNTTVILWAARFGFSAAGTLVFNATPDADTAAYRSNLTLLVCSERESRPFLTASAAQLCALSCASRCLFTTPETCTQSRTHNTPFPCTFSLSFSFPPPPTTDVLNPMPSEIRVEWNSSARDMYNVFLLNLNCSGAAAPAGVRTHYRLAFALEARNPDQEYAQLAVQDAAAPTLALVVMLAAAAVFVACVGHAAVRVGAMYVRCPQWCDVMYDESRFHYGAGFLLVLFCVCAAGACLYAYWMGYAARGTGDVFAAYFGHLFAAVAHAASLALIEMWVFHKTTTSSSSTASSSTSASAAVEGRLRQLAMWCFLLVACVFYEFYSETARAWAATLMCTALVVWMTKPLLRLVAAVHDAREDAARAGTAQEQTRLLAGDSSSAEKEDDDDDTSDAAATAPAAPRTTLWQVRVAPFFANPWPLLFVCFGAGEVLWVVLPCVLPWHHASLRLQPFMPILLAALASVLLFDRRFVRPGPPKEHRIQF